MDKKDSQSEKVHTKFYESMRSKVRSPILYIRKFRSSHNCKKVINRKNKVVQRSTLIVKRPGKPTRTVIVELVIKVSPKLHSMPTFFNQEIKVGGSSATSLLRTILPE